MPRLAFLANQAVMSSTNNDLPKRPRFSWNIGQFPWNDGKGSQEDYVNAVISWSSFHDKLPQNNSSKIPKELRGIMLQSHLYGGVTFSEIDSDDGVDKICKALHKKDALSVVSNAYSEFLTLLSTKRGTSESYQNFESRFAAAVSILNSHASNTLPESFRAFMLLANSGVDTNQRISILAAATPLVTTVMSNMTDQQLLDSIEYEPISSVLRQCDKPNFCLGTNTIRANNSNFRKNPRRNYKCTPRQLAEVKARSQCKVCKEWGHWHSDHHSDGSLKPGVKSSKSPPEAFKSNSVPRKSDRKSVTFHMAKFSSSKNSSDEKLIGPLLDDAAPYSGIGFHELKLLSPYLNTNWNGKLDPLPESVSDRSHWQYGSGNHSSDSRRMLGSVIVSACLDDGTVIKINHIVIEGSSQWVIGRNFTAKCDIIYSKGNYLKLPNNIEVPLENIDLHSYIASRFFLNEKSQKLLVSKQNLFVPQVQFLILKTIHLGKRLRRLSTKSTSMFVATRS